jgi:hypothetical protein
LEYLLDYAQKRHGHCGGMVIIVHGLAYLRFNCHDDVTALRGGSDLRISIGP